MPDSTPVIAPASRVAQPTPAEAAERLALKRRLPTAADVRAEAKRRLPNFAYEYCDGGAGGADTGIARNNDAFDAIELVPRYGKVVVPPPTDCELFGRRYAAPIGLAPDVLWFQLYRFARNDHAIGFDLVKRADAAGVDVLMLTMDTPIRTTRTRE